MSDENKETIEATATPEQAPASSAPDNQTAGALLRKAREAAGLHIGALAVSMRVPLKKLELLESDRYDQLPDPAFVRALASSVCRTLKIDAEPILTRLPQTDKPRLTADGVGMNVPFQRPSDLIGAAWWSQLPKPVIVLVLLLLAGVLTLLFMPDAEQGETATAPAAAPATQAAAEAALPLAAPVQSTPPSPLAKAAPALPVAAVPAPPAPAAPTPPVVSVTAPKTTAPAPAAPQTQAAPAKPAEVVARTPAATPASSAAGGVLVFKTRGTSWVEVTDAQGGVLLRRNLESGETVGVSGNPPLAVVIGRADATEVWLRGKPFPLQGVSSENVARFEVK